MKIVFKTAASRIVMSGFRSVGHRISCGTRSV